MDMNVLEGMNAAQAEAVETLEGPLLILAGAGSGKTTTLTHRIANLIMHGVRPDEILAVTFTNKAARAMREKLGRLLDRDAESRMFMPFMGTFHSICVKLLRMEAGEIGLSQQFVIFDEQDRMSLIRQIIKDLGVTEGGADNKSYAHDISAIVSKAKNDFVEPDEFASNAKGAREKSIARVYAEYEERRKKNSALDFDDLLLYAARMLRDYPKIRKKWQERFRHILIDEYQDTNAVQYRIVKSLVNKERNICVVGDDWQSIYSWRGADFTNILNFERDFPGAKVVKLEQNYRSTQPILTAAQNVIIANKQRTDKALWTDKKDGEPVTLVSFYDDENEAAAVVREIENGVENLDRKLSDYAVLYRTNAQSFRFERAMLEMQMPYKILGGLRYFDRKEVKDMMAYLRLVYQPNDIVSFSRIYNTPSRKLGAKSLESFLDYFMTMMSDDYSLISALLDAELINGLTKPARAALVRLGEVLAMARTKLGDGVPIAEVVQELVKQTGYEAYIKAGEGAEDRLENIKVLVDEVGGYSNLEEFLADAALMSSADDEAKEAVTLMTLHSAKGLEFPIVFVVGVEEGYLPSSQAVNSGKPEAIEEERRLMYVGMTRAQEKLFLSFVGSRFSYGKWTPALPSRFLADLGDGVEVVDNSRGYKNYARTQRQGRGVQNGGGSGWPGGKRGGSGAGGAGRMQAAQEGIDEVFEEDFGVWEVGDRVLSEKFGAGTITDVDGASVEVRFDDAGVKRLNLEYARLNKM